VTPELKKGSLDLLVLTVLALAPRHGYEIGRLIDPGQPIGRVQTLDEMVADSVATEGLAGRLLGTFAGIALLLVALGVYAVVAGRAAARTREIGIRVALGARSSAVLGPLLRQTALPIGIGLAIGLVAAAGLTRLMTTLLFGVAPTDPATFAAVGPPPSPSACWPPIFQPVAPSGSIQSRRYGPSSGASPAMGGRHRGILRKSRAKRDYQEPVGEHSDGLPAKRRLKPPSTTAVRSASLGALLAGPAKRGATTSSRATVSPAVSPEGAQDRFQGGRGKRASIVTTSALEDV
jgi:hypothetical protein